MTVAGITGLSFAALAERVSERRLPWLEAALLDELERGRITLDEQGIYVVVVEMFDEAVFAALAGWAEPK